MSLRKSETRSTKSETTGRNDEIRMTRSKSQIRSERGCSVRCPQRISNRVQPLEHFSAFLSPATLELQRSRGLRHSFLIFGFVSIFEFCSRLVCRLTG